jgi:hypothetical protein
MFFIVYEGSSLGQAKCEGVVGGVGGVVLLIYYEHIYLTKTVYFDEAEADAAPSLR